MDMIRDASVSRLKSRFYTFGSFESFTGHIPITPFSRPYQVHGGITYGLPVIHYLSGP